MFNSFKKWVKNEDVQQQAGVFPPTEGMKTMNEQLQRKFAKGVHYNLKIVIRGDKNVGKTCLWHRLQGHKFVEEYIPTPEIQSTSIHWNYKATDDIVKVDVWDVVDKGKKKTSQKNLKVLNDDVETEEHVLDAQFLDVYKGANAVILMFDITKKWTFTYVERELPKIPTHLPVLVLANNRDMGSHRTVGFDEVESFVQYTDRPPGSPSVMFLETSMKNGFGLKYIHKFFNLPFLLNQRESLLKQLERNHLDVESCLEELQYHDSSDEQNYDVFVSSVRQKTIAAKNEPIKSSTPNPAPAPSKPQPPAENKNPQPQEAKPEPTKPSSLNNTKNDLFSSSQMITANTAPPTTTPTNEKKGFMSRFFGGGNNATTTPEVAATPEPPKQAPKPSKHVEPVKDIDEFVPDDDVDDFLNDDEGGNAYNKSSKYDSSSDDEDGINPMVAGFQEELDSDDDIPSAAIPPKQTYYSSSEDEVPPVEVKYEPETISSYSQPESLPDVKTYHTSSSDEEEPYKEVQPSNILPNEPVQHTEEPTPVLPPTNVRSGSYETHVKEHVKNVVEDQPEAESEDDEDVGNNMVSTVYDDISEDEAPSHVVPKQPVAIVLPVQAAAPVEDTLDDYNNGDKSLNIQFNSADLDFLEKSFSSPSDLAKSPTDEVKSSRRKSKTSEDSEEPRKHKKHKKKSKEGGESKEERKKKHKSKKSKRSKDKERNTPVVESGKDNDLEDFLGGPVVASNNYETL